MAEGVRGEAVRLLLQSRTLRLRWRVSVLTSDCLCCHDHCKEYISSPACRGIQAHHTQVDTHTNIDNDKEIDL